MAEGSGFRKNPAMGIELRAGHVHRDRQGRSPAPAQSHRPAGRKHVQQATSKGTAHRVETPELPRLRALEAQAASIPISSSAASSTSPRSGSSRVHPYPVGEAAEGSSFELVPSVATQAAQSWGQGESMEVTPIRDADTSPITPVKPIQVMSPNLGQGMASGSTRDGAAESELDLAMARAILQSWSETRGEDGTVQRTYTQCAHEWPLLESDAFDNIESALNILKRACEYLHDGMMQMGGVVDQKANIPSVEAAVRALAGHVQEVRSGVQDTVTRQSELSVRVDRMSERLQDRMEMVATQLDQGNRENATQTEVLKRSIEETQKQVSQVGSFLELSRVDSQRIDKGLVDLRENVFNNAVAIDHLREDCQREADNQRTLSGQTADIAAYQRHAESPDQTLAQCQTQMAVQAGRISEGEIQLRRLREEVAALSSQSVSRMDEGNVPNRDPELAVRLSQLEEGLRAQQRVLKQMQKDCVEDAKEVKQYLDQIHDLVTDTLQAAEPSTPERARVESTRLTKVARKGDLRVEVEDTEFCRVGEIVLIGGQEARTVLGKSSLIFKVPLDGEYPEGTAVRTLQENEFLQVDGENVYVYERRPDGASHLVCGVDLTYRASPEWAEERDDVQDQVYSDNLDQRVQRAVEARLGTSRPVVSGTGGPMVPPWTTSHAHEWSTSKWSTACPSPAIFWKEGGR